MKNETRDLERAKRAAQSGTQRRTEVKEIQSVFKEQNALEFEV
jgi:hypothetical protein